MTTTLIRSNDPLLQPYQLKHLTLRNRIMSTAHEPNYHEDGMPKDQYRLYHVEKAKGGIAMTMTAGSAIVSQDSPPAFGNLLAYKDEIIPWLKRLTDECHDYGTAVMIQLTHLGRRTNWNKADWLPILAPSQVREPAHRAFPEGDGRLGHRAHRQGLCCRGRAHEGGRPRWLRIRMLRPSSRSVLVARHQQAHR